VVLDPFLGSGTTVIAAERTGRVCYGLELDPLYMDTLIRRWQRRTRCEAIHLESGDSFGVREARTAKHSAPILQNSGEENDEA
jgi:hypothetical protein